MLGQEFPITPDQWGPLGLSASLVGWFLLALKKRWIRWGSDCDEQVSYWKTYGEQMKAERDDAWGQERRLRDSIENKLAKANEELARAAQALERRK